MSAPPAAPQLFVVPPQEAAVGRSRPESHRPTKQRVSTFLHFLRAWDEKSLE